MEIDTSLIIAAGGFAFTAGGSLVGFGILKNKVEGLTKRAENARADREKLFDRVNELERLNAEQQVRLDNLEGAREELFRLAKDTSKAVSDLTAAIQVLTSEVRKLEEEIKKK